VLRGAVAIVAGGDTALGAELAAGLEDAGAVVAITTSRFASGRDARHKFAAFAPFRVLVHVPTDDAASPRALLVATDEHDWEERGEGLLRSALWSCQGAHDLMVTNGGGRIVLVTPTVGLVGGAERVPLATAAEGMRTLAKVAARQWGRSGITVNCVAVAVDPVERGPLPPALGRAVDARRDIAAAVALLAGERARAVTGVTIPVDGGVVML
jgi:NAD(P)-dependent dehydrogenase (short-subunit alcohol dehydrogenase family)